MILQTIEISQYIRKVKLSNSRKVKYYKKGGLAPKAIKYSKPPYVWVDMLGGTFLCDGEGERVVANPRAAGTPRYMAINGQKIYNGECSPHTRNKVLSTIKESFGPYVDKMDDITEYPISIVLEMHDTIREGGSGSLWDADNRAWPYIKAFQDCLTGNKDKTGKARCKQVLPDDNVLFIPGPPATKFIPVDSEEDRKLVFIIIKEEDPRIVKHKGFCEQLKIETEKYGFKRISYTSQQDLETRTGERVKPCKISTD
jgi:hypothetical protein